MPDAAPEALDAKKPAARTPTLFPFPPRRMRVEAAAYYLGMSETAFRALGIEPVRIGGTVGWLREDLDAWLDQKRGWAPAEAPEAVDPFTQP